MNKTLCLGLDFGNVIKVNGQNAFVPGFQEAYNTLDHIFGNEIYIVSRVDDEAGEQRNRKWLEDHHLGQWLGKLYFCRERKEKAELVSGLHLTHFIDNRMEVLHYMAPYVKHRIALAPTTEQVRNFYSQTDAFEPPIIIQHWFQAVKYISGSMILMGGP